MTTDSIIHRQVRRRTLIVSLSSAALTHTAGCGDKQLSSPRGEESAESLSSDRADEKRRAVKFIEEVENIYHRLSMYPLVKDDEFVFDVTTFEDDFDHNELLNRANSVLESIETGLSRDATGVEVQSLVSVTELAKLLVHQRVTLHQFIAAVLTGRENFYGTNFDQAVEYLTKAQRFLTDIDRLGNQIGGKLPREGEVDADIEYFDPVSIQETQKILVEIVYWSIPAIEGLQYASSGLKWFMEGHKAADDHKYGDGASAYEKSNELIEMAEVALTKTLSRGRRVPYIAPFVDQVRCLLPAYITGSERLIDSMEEYNAGNENRAKAIARDAFVSVDKQAKKCY